MPSRFALAVLALSLSLTGCVNSLQPLCGPGELQDDALLGEWIAESRFTQVRGAGIVIRRASGTVSGYRPRDYDVVVNGDDGVTRNYTANLIELGGARYIDLVRKTEVGGVDHSLASDVLLVHHIVRYEVEGAAIRFGQIDHGSMHRLLSEGESLPHTKADQRIVLTASTRELQKFIAKYGKDLCPLGPDSLRRKVAPENEEPRPGAGERREG